MFKKRRFKLNKDLPPRSLAEVQQEFVNGCAEVGACQFQIERLTKELGAHNAELFVLSTKEQTDETKSAANKLFADAGSCEYQIGVYKDELLVLRKKLAALNNEAFKLKASEVK